MIGTHIVTVAGPSLEWGNVLNTNPAYTTDLHGWMTRPGSAAPFVWDAGRARADVGPTWPAWDTLDPSWTWDTLAPLHTWDSIGGQAIIGLDHPAGYVMAAVPNGQYQITTTFDLPTTSNNSTARIWLVAAPTVADLDNPARRRGYTTTTFVGPGAHTITSALVLTNLPPAYTVLTVWLQLIAAYDRNLGSAYVDSLEVRTLGYPSVDLTCLVDEASIQHGRSDTTSQPDASTATLDLSWTTGEDSLPDVVEIGGLVTIDTEYPPDSGSIYRRFVGRISDISLGWDEAGEDTPNRVVAQIAASDLFADLGRRVVGDTPFPQELDGARVARIMALANVTLTQSDPGTVAILPRDIDSQPALGVAQETATSAQGMIWATRDGQVRYADANHRRGIPISVTLDACDLLVSPEWKRDTSALLNDLSIGYGPQPEQGEQPRWLASDPNSIARFGVYASSITTELAAQGDAASMGSLMLARQASPAWVMSELPVDIDDLDDDRTSAILRLDIHDLVALTGLPVAGQAPTTATLFVEGWQESVTWESHQVVLVISDYRYTGAPPRWNDVDPAWIWDAVDPAMTWDDAVAFPPPLTTETWDAVPASTLWDNVPPAVTWDTYTLDALG